jgi:type IV pilus assembly protein PilA
MRRAREGFTLVELMIVVAIVGVLAAMAIPNFIAMQDRAKEGSIKFNMHTFQMTAEDYSVQYNGFYATTAGQVVALMPGVGSNFRNPFTHGTGSGTAWEERATLSTAATATPGITSYADSASGMTYNIKGYGKTRELTLVLSAGQ